MNPVAGALGIAGMSGIAGTVVGAAFPMKSLYNSGQENRGLISTGFHLGIAGAVGVGAGYATNLGAMAIASKIAKGV